MATKIHGDNSVIFIQQAGRGIPIHISPKGTMYVDITTADVYMNKDGLSLWELIGGSSGSGSTINAFSYNSNNNTFTIDTNIGSFNAAINNVSGLTVENQLISQSISATTYLGLPSFTLLTGGTYDSNTGIATFINSTGGTFDIPGFFKPSDDIFTTGLTFDQNTYILTGIRNDDSQYTANLSILASDVTITGGTYNPNNGVATFTNNSGGTFNVSGFTSGLTDTKISSYSYNQLNNTFTITDTTGGTFNAGFQIVSGLTVNGNLNVTGTTSIDSIPNITTSGFTLLATSGSSGIIQGIELTNGLNGLFFKQNGNTFGNTAILGTNDDFDLIFKTNNLNHGGITNSGNFLFGKTAQTENFKVDISGNTSIYGSLTQANSISNGLFSHAEGSATTSNGNYSHAEGANTLASGLYSHSEGINTLALGNYSHSQGNATSGTANASHAEGVRSLASGAASHAEGSDTIASNQYSHAEGQNTLSSGVASHAEGSLTSATTFYSHSEGINTLASGQYAHAEGNNTRATGNASHAEGTMNLASGSASHAEGSGTTSSGAYSHTEGQNTTASGASSHAEGINTLALGNFSHAEGSGTTAIGIGSHAGGLGTIANVQNSTVFGKYNATGNTNEIFVIGGGDTNNRKNALLIEVISSITTTNIFDNLKVSGVTYSSERLISPIINGQTGSTGDITIAPRALSSGGNIFLGSQGVFITTPNAHGMGIGTTSPNNILHINRSGSSALGLTIQNQQGGSVNTTPQIRMMGRGGEAFWHLWNDMSGPTYLSASTLYSEFRVQNSNSGFIFAVPRSSSPTSKTVFTFVGINATVNGVLANYFELLENGNALLNQTAGNTLIGSNTDLGYKLQVSGTTSISSLPAPTGPYNIVVAHTSDGQLRSDSVSNIFGGSYFNQSGNTFGDVAILGTNDNNSLIFKTNNLYHGGITNSGNFLFGKTAQTGSFKVDISGNTSIYGSLTQFDNVSSGQYSHAEGSGSTASGNYSHAEGLGTLALGTASHAEGIQVSAITQYSHAEGGITLASASYAHAEGVSTISSGVASHAEGNSTMAIGNYSHSEGSGTTSSGEGSHTEGSGTISNGQYSHAEGFSTTANTSYSHSEGFSTISYGSSSHSEGNNTIAYGPSSHVEGSATTTYGLASHAEGQNTITSGSCSHAEGSNTLTTGFASHSEGLNTTASGDYSHSEGSATTASGIGAHAEGQQTIASGRQAHAEGYLTIASGLNSHAEGRSTIASGAFSHAEGLNTISDGPYSHTLGESTVALHNYQFVAGRFNVTATTSSNDYFIIGCGYGGSNRADGFKLTRISGSSSTIVLPQVVNLDFLDDTTASLGGVPIGGVYHTGGILKIRLT